MTATWDSLTAALAGVPELPGARCVGKWSTFDETDDPETTAYAINLCRACPVLAGCKEWFDSLPPKKRPSGVIAGRVN